MAEQVMIPLDYEMAAEVHQHLKSKKVEFYLNEAVSAFELKLGRLIARLSSGKELRVDLAVLGIGVRPESYLAREAGLKTGERGGIRGARSTTSRRSSAPTLHPSPLPKFRSTSPDQAPVDEA